MSNIYLCSFASFNLAPSAYRFYHQALSMGIFEDIFIYNECNLPSDFKVHFRDKIYVDSNSTNYAPHFNTTITSIKECSNNGGGGGG